LVSNAPENSEVIFGRTLWCETLLYPKAVAVIGASRSPEKVGPAVLANLVNGGFTGTIVPVNPGTDEILL